MAKQCDLEEVIQVARLHLRCLPNGLLSCLGEKFLMRLYQQIFLSENVFILTKKLENEVIGFISGGSDLNSIYKGLLKKPDVFITLFKALALKPWLLIQIFELINRKNKSDTKIMREVEAELFSIVVHPRYRGQNIGEGLFKELCREFSKRGITKFKVVVGDGLTEANAFYLKQGAQLMGRLDQGLGKTSTIYEVKVERES